MLLCAKRAYPCIAASIASLPAFIVVRIAKRSNCVSSSLGSVFNAQERWKRYGAEVELSKLLRGIEFARAGGGVTALRKQEQRCCLNVAAYSGRPPQVESTAEEHSTSPRSGHSGPCAPPRAGNHRLYGTPVSPTTVGPKAGLHNSVGFTDIAHSSVEFGAAVQSSITTTPIVRCHIFRPYDADETWAGHAKQKVFQENCID
jgi:hypothetical protein